MLRKRKNNKIQLVTIDCFVNDRVLQKIVEKGLEPKFFVEFSKLDKNDKLIKEFEELNLHSVSKISDDNYIDIVIISEKQLFNRLLKMLIECNAEVVVLYFPINSTHFDKFLYNKIGCNNPQKAVVENGLCELVCTWVTNEDKLHFCFDSLKYTSEMITQMILSG